MISSTAGSQTLVRKSISDITATSNRTNNSTRLRRTHHLKSTTSSLRHSAGESSHTEDDFEDSEGSNCSNTASNANFLRKSPKLKTRNHRSKCDRKSTNFQDCNKSSNSLIDQEMTMKRADSPAIVSVPFERTHMSMTLSLPLSSSPAPPLSSLISGNKSAIDSDYHSNVNKSNLGVNNLYKLNSSRDNNRKRNFESCDKINDMRYDDGSSKRQKCDDSEFNCSVRQNPIVNKLLDNVKHWEHSNSFSDKMCTKKSLDLNVINSTARDSGFSSCGSSQELSPVISNDFCSQETYCTEVDTQLSNTEPDSQDTVDGVGFTSVSQELGSIKSTDSNLTTHSSISDDVTDDRDSIIMSRSTPTLPSFVPSSSQYYTDSETFTSSPLGHTISDTGGAAPIINTDSSFTQCMMCLTEPKNGVFVHNNFLHLCCCYKCAMKVWAKSKRCPVCNCKVKNVMKLYVH